MTNKLNLTWQDVIYSYAPNVTRWGDAKEFLPLVKMIGYRYFEWNGRIYELISIRNVLDAKDTGIKASEL